MINCFKDSLHVLMSVLICTNDDDAREVLVDHVNGHWNDEVRSEEEEDDDEGQTGAKTLTLKSSLRKSDSIVTDAEKREKNKKVQWVDFIGKELAEIREFKPSEEEDIDSDRGKTCDCIIL